ncbi:MAG: glutamate--tRNA ligase [Mycoplasmataceae bacterium]|nr:glutamate--tRNA ligase [Mycoplasmataceae bacterium]
MKVKTRYAPSPTGFFHIGGARTALFNYLFAKHYNGEFIVRIEDTDQERHIETGIDSQLDGIEWLGFEPDESLRKPGNFGPYRQTEKLARYQQLAKELVEQGKAYYCFCTKEELEKQRETSLQNGQTPKYNRHCLLLSKEEIQKKLDDGVPAAIRLKIDDDAVFEWNDIVRGKISVPASALTDPTILRSNGIPLYNFGVVIDDYDMEITHVLRGEEHIANTPYQMAIRTALGFDKYEIKYGHMSIIVDAEGKKLSKRDKTLKQFIEDYKMAGYVPEAVTNFLSLLGWSPKDNQEVKSIDELVKSFDEKRLSTAPAFFDVKKMDWLSNTYFKKMEDDKYLKFIKPFVTLDLSSFGDKADEILLIYKPQISYATQLNSLIDESFLHFDVQNFEEEVKNMIKTEAFKTNICALKKELEDISEIILENADEIVNKIKASTGLKGKELFMPIRIAAIGKEHGPEMKKILSIVGKNKILKNILTLGF